MTPLRIALVGALALGCFSDTGPNESSCEPGEQVACDCVDGGGVQVCAMSGLGFEPCQCGDDTGASSSASASGTDSGTTTGATTPDVVINELVHQPAGGGSDEWIELHNPGADPVDLAYWKITDGFNIFDMPPGTTIDPNGYLVYTRNQAGSFTYELPDEGMVQLLDEGYDPIDMTSWDLGDASEPYSWGRLPNGTGPFADLTPTKGAPNQ